MAFPPDSIQGQCATESLPVRLFRKVIVSIDAYEHLCTHCCCVQKPDIIIAVIDCAQTTLTCMIGERRLLVRVKE